jgi:hypothetical protein
MKRGILQQIPLKLTEPLGIILKNLPNKLENLEEKTNFWTHMTYQN